MRIPIASAALLVLAACGGGSGAEETSASTDGIIGGELATAYPEAGYLDIDASEQGAWACSAALIAPKVVLTAGHCIDGHKQWQFHVGKEIRTSTDAATYDWNEGGANKVNPNHHDVGLIFLETPIDLPSYPTIAQQKLPDNAKIVNVGRIKDGELTNRMWAAESRVTDGAGAGYPLAYLSTLVIQPGDSGGPDFAAGTHTIVAVNSGAGANIEVLARVDLLAGWIAQQIAAHTDIATCDAESEENRSFGKAQTLSVRGTCAKLGSPTDQDWFQTTFGPGAVTVDLAGDGDATFAVGTAEGSTCAPTITGLRSISLTSTNVKKLCFRVMGTAQSYTISRR